MLIGFLYTFKKIQGELKDECLMNETVSNLTKPYIARILREVQNCIILIQIQNNIY